MAKFDFDQKLDAALGVNEQLPDQTSGLSYAENLNEESAKSMLGDRRFIDDIYSYYGERDGKTFSSQKEAVSYYLNDRRWRNNNTISVARDVYDAHNSSDVQATRLARMQTVFDALPFAADGETGDAILDNAAAMLADPINLIGFGSGGAAARAAVAAAPKGMAANKIRNLGLKAAAKAGAKSEALAGGIAEGVLDIGMQARDQEIGLQDGYSVGRAALATGLGAATGGVLGAGFGVAGAVTPSIKGGGNAIQQGGVDRRNQMRADLRAEGRGYQEPTEAVEPPENQVLSDIAEEYRAERKARINEAIDQEAIDPADAAGVTRVSSAVDTADIDEKISNIEWVQQWPQRRAVIQSEIESLNEASATGVGGNPQASEQVRLRQRELEAGDSAYQQVVELARRKLQAGDADVGEAIDEAIDQISPTLREFNPGRTTDPNAEQVTPDAQQPQAQAPEQTTAQADQPTDQPVAEADQPQAEGNADALPEAETEAVDPQERLATIEQRLSRRVGSIDKDLAGVRREIKQRVENGEDYEDLNTRVEELKKERNDLKAERAELEQLQANETQQKVDEVVSESTPVTEEPVESDPYSVFDDEPDPVKVEPESVATVETMLADSLNAERATHADVRNAMIELGFDGKEIDDVVGGLPKGKSKSAVEARRAMMRTIIEEAIGRQQLYTVMDGLVVDGRMNDIFFNEDAMTAIVRQKVEPRFQDVAINEMRKQQRAMAKDKIAKAYYQYGGRASAADVIEQVRSETNNDHLIEVIEDILSSDNMDSVLFAPRKRSQAELNRVHEAIVESLSALKQAYPNIQGAYSLFKQRTVEAMISSNPNMSPDAVVKFIGETEEALFDQFLRLEEYQVKTKKGEVLTLKSLSMRTTRDPSVPEAVADAADHMGRVQENYGTYNAGSKGVVSGRQVTRVQSILRSLGGNNAYHGRTLDRVGIKNEATGQSNLMSATESARIKLEEARIESASANRMVRDDIAREDAIIAYHEKIEAGEQVSELQNPVALEEAIQLIKSAEGKIKYASEMRDKFDLNSFEGREKEKAKFEYYDNKLKEANAVMRSAVDHARQLLGGNADRDLLRNSKIGVQTNLGKITEIERLSQSLSTIDQDASLSPEEIVSKKKATVKQIDKLRAELESIGDGDEANLSAEELQNRDPVALKQQLRDILYPMTHSAQKVAVGNQVLKARSSAQRKWARLSSQKSEAARKMYAARRAGNAQKVVEYRKQLDAINEQEADIAKAADAEYRQSLVNSIEKLKAIVAKPKNLSEEQLTYLNGRIANLEKRIKNLKKGAGLERFNLEQARSRQMMQLMADEIRRAKLAEADNRSVDLDESRQNIEQIMGQKMTDEEYDLAGQMARLAEHDEWLMSVQDKKFEALSDDATNGMPSEQVAQAAQSIVQETEAARAVTPPTTRPQGSRAPRMVVIRGKQFDMANDVETASVGNGQTHFYVDGDLIAKTFRSEDGSKVVVSAGGKVKEIKIGKDKGYVDEVYSFIAINNFDRLAAKADANNVPDAPAYTDTAVAVPDYHQTTRYDGVPEVDTDVHQDNPIVDAPPVEEVGTGLFTKSAVDFPLANDKNIAIQIIDPSHPDFGKVIVPLSGQRIGQAAGRNLKEDQVVIGQVNRFNPKARNKDGLTGSDSVEAKKSFRPLSPDARFVKFPQKSKEVITGRDAGVVTPVANPNSLPDSPRARSNRPYTEGDLQSLEITKDMLPGRLAEMQNPPKNARELHTAILRMEMVSWNQLKNPQRMAMFVDQLEKSYALLDTVTQGRGVKYSNQTRQQSYRELKTLIAKRDPKNVAQITSIFNSIAGGRISNGAPDESMPMFTAEDWRFTFRPGTSEAGVNSNRINIGATDPGVPDVINFAHEMGHWGYFNVLTPKERMEFWKVASKYMTDNGVDVPAMTARLPGVNGADELTSPAEFFANQFALYVAKRNESATASLFKKFAGSVAELINKVMGKKTEVIDPDLVAMFDRIMPDNGLDVDGGKLGRSLKNQFDPIYAQAISLNPDPEKATTLSVIAQQLKDMRDMQIRLEEELELMHRTDYGNPMALVEILNEVASDVYGKFGGRPGSKTHRSGAKRVGLLDSYEQGLPAFSGQAFVVNGKTYRKFKYHNERVARGRLLSASRTIQEVLSNEGFRSKFTRQRGEITTDMDSQMTPEMIAELNELIATQNDDILDLDYERAIEAGESGVDLSMGSTWDETVNALSKQLGASKGTEEDSIDILVTVANDMINALDGGLVEMVKAFNRNMQGSVERAPNIDISGRVFKAGNAKAKRARRYIRANDVKLAQSLIEAMQTAAQKLGDSDIPDDQLPVGRSLHDMDMRELLTRYGEVKGTGAGTPYLREIQGRASSTPYKGISSTDAQAKFPELYNRVMAGEEMEVFSEAVESGNYDMANYAIGVANVRGKSLDIKSRLVKDAIEREVEHTSAPSRMNGIPQKAPAAIKEALSKITHRDKNVEFTARQIAYRVLNLMGRTTQDELENTAFISVDDLYKMAGMGSAPQNMDGAMVELAPLKGEAFNELRKNMRKYAIALAQGKGDPLTLIHELGHLTVRTTFEKTDRDFMLSAFEEAIKKNDKVATDFLQAYTERAAQTGQPMTQEQMAEEWFVERFAMWMGERVAKGDMWKLRGPNGSVTELSMKGKLASFADTLYQRLAYVLNSLIGRKSLRQQFRQMTYYGDMFKARRDEASLVNTVNNTTFPFVNHRLGTSYIRQRIDTMPREKLLRLREYLGAGPDEDLMDYAVFHGTPNGQAFNRVMNPDVYIHPTEVGGVYGPGVYVTPNPDFAQEFADGASGRMAFIRKMADGKQKQELIELMEARQALQTRSEDLTLDRLLGDNTHRREIESIELQLNSIDEVIAKALGFERMPKVLPMFVRKNKFLSLRIDEKFELGNGGENDLLHLFMTAKEKGYIDDEKLNQVFMRFESTPAEDADGNFVLAAMERSFGGLDKAYKFLQEEGYEGVIAGMPGPATSLEYVAFSPNSVKHVDAAMFDVDQIGMYARLIDDPQAEGVAGRAMEQVAFTEEPLNIDDMISITESVQRAGVSEAVLKPIRKALRKDNITPDDVDAVAENSSVFKYFKENSQRLRMYGANWLADIVKPENGTGIYERHDVELADKIMPIFNALKELDDNKGWASRWMRRNVPLFAKMSFGALDKKYARPQSFDRIIGAIRRGELDVRKLNSKEQAVARMVISAFEAERKRLLDAGLPVGDARRGPGQYYVPQQWDTELIRENPRKAVDAFTQFFMQESRKPDYEYPVLNEEQARRKATDLIDSMIDSSGETYGDDVLRRAVGDPFYRRVINLQPGQYDFMEEFLINDLEGLLVQYFDRSTRKIAISKKFGAGGHGYNSYITAVERGTEGAVETLLANKTIRYRNRQYQAEALVEEQIIPPIPLSREQTKQLVDAVQQIVGESKDTARKQHAINLVLSKYNPEDQANPNVRVRAESIVNALSDFPKGVAHTGRGVKLVQFADDMMDVLNKRPLAKYSENEIGYKVSRSVKAFNSITLLSMTTLTSLGDPILPMVRSGNVGAFLKAQAKYWSNPEYRSAAKNIGTGIENLLHDRMVQMAGEGSQKLQNSFFNFTLLTPWTNINREIAGMVGYEAFKSEVMKARRLASNGNTNSYSYKTSERFLRRYGLTGPDAEVDFLSPNVEFPMDLREADMTNHKALRYAMIRFVNEAIFTPNPNDIPLWAQTPWGSMIFQLKSFQLMMARMGKYVLDEAAQGNPRPLTYLATAGVGMGWTSIAVKDVLQSRGGDDEESRALRNRSLNESAPIIAKALGIEEGDVNDEIAGNYVEGLLAIGGLGLFAELLYNSAQQADNGKYGFVRTAGAFFGPSVGVLEDIYDVGIAGPAGLFDEEKNARRREAVRSVVGRVPVFGQQRGLREDVVDAIAGPGARDSKKRQSGFGGGGFGNGGF